MLNFSQTGVNALIFLFLALGALAEPIEFTVGPDGAGKTHQLALDAESIDGVPCVNIKDVFVRLGGSTFSYPGRIKMKLGTLLAWANADELQVDAPRGVVMLNYPVTEGTNAFMMAAADLPALLHKGFGLPTQRTDEASPAPDVQPVEQSVVMSELPAPDDRTTQTCTVVLDPGHGGSDTGITGSRITEKQIALQVANAAKRQTEQTSNTFVHLTRTEDRDVPLELRTREADKKDVDLFLSLHAGASRAQTAHGFELFVSAPPLTPLAPLQANSGVSPGIKFAQNLEAALLEETGMVSNGIHTVPIRQLSGLTIPAVLLEVGVLSNPAEETLLADSAHIERIGKAIARAIELTMEGTPHDF